MILKSRYYDALISIDMDHGAWWLHFSFGTISMFRLSSYVLLEFGHRLGYLVKCIFSLNF